MSSLDPSTLSIGDKVFCRPIPTVDDKTLYFLIKIADKIEGGFSAMIFRTSALFNIKIENCEFMKLTKENEIKIFKDGLLGGKNGKLKTYIASLESTSEKYVPDEDDHTTPETTSSDTTTVESNEITTTTTGETKPEETKKTVDGEKELKRKRNEQTEIEENTESSLLDRSLKIPQWVKEYLHKDYIQVSREEKEYPLIKDMSKSVKGIIDTYLKANEERSNDDFGILKYSMDGLLQFFDACFEKPSTLLYLIENSTFKNKVKESPSHVYGLPHLLRFCVSLPSILAKMSPEISLDQETISIIYGETEKLFNYLEENLQNI